jgi:guanylate kinase
MSGSLLIVSAPSGAGKTTLVRGLLERDAQIQLSISHTTRAPRPGERHGKEYHFIDVATFTAMRERGDFLEWAEVHGNFYGTSKAWIAQQMASGRDIILEIDWQGARQVRTLFPEAVGIFILPPSLDVLATRLNNRAQDSAEVIARRLAAAQDEMRHVDEFDYVIINNELHQALESLVSVVTATRLRFANQRARFPECFDFFE